MKKKVNCFEGTIVPISWEKSGAVRRISVFTPEGEDLILQHHYSKSQVKQLLNQQVRVFGNLGEEHDQCRVVKVRRIVKMRGLKLLQAS